MHSDEHEHSILRLAVGEECGRAGADPLWRRCFGNSRAPLCHDSEMVFKRRHKSAKDDLEAHALDLHQLEVGAAVTYHKYVFLLGRAAHPHVFTQQCLDGRVATSAIDNDGDLLLPRRFRSIGRRLRVLNRLDSAVSSGRLPSLLLTLIRHPTGVGPVLRATTRKHSGSESEASERSGDGRSVADVIQGIHHHLAEGSALESIANAVDHDALRPQYLAGHPWCRLTLPPYEVVDRNGSQVACDVTALVHRSGVVVLTLIEMATDSCVGELNAASFGSNRRFTEVRLDAWLASAAGRDAVTMSDDGWETSEDDPGVTVLRSPEGANLDDIFYVYRDAIAYVVNGGKVPLGTEEWLHYPVISLRETPDDQIDVVGGALASRLGTAQLDSRDLPRAHVPADVLDSGWAKGFVSLGGAAHAFTGLFRSRLLKDHGSLENVPGQEWMWFEFSVCLAVDVALLRLWLVEEFVRQLDHTTLDASPKSDYGVVLDSYREISGDRLLSFGQLEAVERTILEAHGFGAKYAAAREHAGVVQAIKSAERTASSTRAVRRLEVLVLFITALAALLGPLTAFLQSDRLLAHAPTVLGDNFENWGPSVLLWSMLGIGIVCVCVLLGGLLRRLLRRVRKPTKVVAAHRSPSRRMTIFAPGPMQIRRDLWKDTADDEDS